MRRTREGNWIARMQHMQIQFDQNYWHQPIAQNALVPRQNLPAAIPAAATAGTVMHNQEVPFQPLLLLCQAQKTNITNPDLYHVVRPGFSAKTGGEVQTNHFAVTLPNRIWVYDISEFPNPITRERKKVLVETMFNCAAFLDTRIYLERHRMFTMATSE